MARIVDGPEITGQVVHKQTGQAYGPVTVTVSPKVYTDREMTASVTSLTTDGTGVFSCYAPPGTYTFTTTAVDSAPIEPVEVLGREGGTGTASAASGAVPNTVVAAAGASQSLSVPAHGEAAYDLTLNSASCAISLSGGTSGEVCKLRVKVRQDGTGGRAYTLPGGIIWPYQQAPAKSVVAGRFDTYMFSTSDGGATFDGEVLGTSYAAPAVPAQVTNVGLSTTSGQVVLTWDPATANGSSVTNYKVYRSTTTGTETLLATVGAVLTYTDSAVSNGTTYFYKVSAVNGIGEGAQSAEGSIVAGAATVVINDTFTAANGSSLNGHTPDTNTPGNVWKGASAASTGFAAATATTFQVQSNQIGDSASTTQHYAGIDSGLANCTIYLDVPTTGDGGPAWRMTDGINGYTISVNTGTVYEENAGVFTSKGTWTPGGSGANYKVVLSGSAHTIFMDSGSGYVQVATFTDAFQSTATIHGFRVNGNTTTRFDNFKVTNP